jgi:quercetin dioxygenase-like cupin family protein
VTTVSNKRFEVDVSPGGPVEMVQVVLDFPSGGAVPTHTHGGPVYVTVLQGAITLRSEQGEQTYQAGQTLTEVPTEYYTAWNPTDGTTRLFATYVLPQGASLTSVQERAVAPAIGPTTVAETRFTIADPPARYEVVQLLLDFPPGAWTPPHTHGGPVVVSVLEGELTERRPGHERKFGPGAGWTENPGDLHAAGNDGPTKASLVTTILLRAGAELTTAQEASLGAAPAPASPSIAPSPARPAAAPVAQVPASLPRTGALPPPTIPLAGLGFALVLAGSMLRRPARAR